MINELYLKIKTKKLTKTEKIIADYFLKKKESLAFLNSNEIALELDISDTSIIRFVKSLGFTNYSDFKQKLQKETSKKITPTEKLIKNETILLAGNMEKHFLENINISINELFVNNSDEKYLQLAKILENSSKKFVVGFKSTSGISSFFGLRLGYIYDNTFTFSTNTSEVIKSIYDISKNDCLIIIGLPKYSKTYEILLEIAKKNGAQIIIITDSPIAPISKYGNLNFYINISSLSFFNSLISAQILIEYMLTYLSKNISNDKKDRISSINEYLLQNL